ncbi:hypothetical protein LCGC14_0549550 [marine sediment metagenome]|uniref:Uncharacterized protein n=1 Tax=marine sediment metagenome TaxID=412755 RepID=A0A0F9UYG8_9ZZZZ
MRPLDVVGVFNIGAEFGQQLEIALQENKQLEEKITDLEETIKLLEAKPTVEAG